AARVLRDAPLGGIAPAVAVDDDLVRLADARGVHADAQPVAPLGDRADDAPGDAAHARERGARAQRHADAVAGIGGRAVERPALHSRAVEECLAHADVVLVAAGGDDHRAPGPIGDRLRAAARDHTRYCAGGIEQQLLG